MLYIGNEIVVTYRMTAEEFRQQIIPFTRKLYPMMKRLLRDEEESRDAVQELMLKLWSRRNNLDQCTNRQAYIISVAKNYCLDTLKKKRPSRISTQEEFKIHALRSEEKSLEMKEGYKQVCKIIEALPEKYREVIRMRDMDGFSFEEIREMTGYEIPHIRVILSRARRKVKKELLKMYDYEQGSEKQSVKQIL